MIERNLPWYAVQVKARSEAPVASALRNKGYEEFLPMYTVRRRWSDRIKSVRLPLFPGYLFCRLDAERRLPVLLTGGVVRIAGVGRRPVPVEAEEMSALEAVVGSGLDAAPSPFLRAGRRVRLGWGPLSGVEGLITEARSPSRLVIGITLLQRSVSVEIDPAWILDDGVLTA